MIYELKCYEAADGQFVKMRDRFLQEAKPRLESFGLAVVGVFETTEENKRLYYVTCASDEVSLKAAWEAFYADPSWKAVKTKTERDGPLMIAQTTALMTAIGSEVTAL